MGAAELYLVRHAQAAGRDDDDPGLSERGRAQARALGARLAACTFATVLHSPRRRAEETATIVSSFLAPTAVASSPLLDDRTPVPSDERRDEYPRRYHQALGDVPAQERDVDAVELREAVSRLVATAEEQAALGPLLLVTHAFVIGWFVRSALETATWRWIGLDSDNTGLTVIRYPPDGPFLVAFNDTGHLAALEPRSADG
ncbi:MAG: histidine phosphatase family protein [Solirubrobacteraceae bacterium]